MSRLKFNSGKEINFFKKGSFFNLTYFISLAFIFCIVNSANAQNSSLLWAKQMGGIGDESGSAVALDASGNVYTIGSFSGTVDFDPGAGIYNLTAINSKDIFIEKLDASGNFVWAKQLCGLSTVFAGYLSIAVGKNGNVYTTGALNGTGDFDPGPGVYNLTSINNDDIFISKLDANGNFIWAKQMGGISFDESHAIVLDASENVYTTGEFNGTSDFDPGPGIYNLSTTGGNSGFVSKLDVNGNFVWAQQVGGRNFDIKVDAYKNVYTTGIFAGTVDMDPGPGVYNFTALYIDIFVSKLGPNGDFVWAKQFAGSAGHTVFTNSYSINIDDHGNVYTTGVFINTFDFDPGPGVFNLGGPGAFVSKLDANGDFIWAIKPNTFCNKVFTDAASNIYIGQGSSISKYNFNSNLIWTKQIGGSGDFTIDAVGNIIASGGFSATQDFDPGPDTYNMTSSGGSDIFILKLKGEPITYTHPKIYTSKGTLNVGQTQTITGKDFTAGGQIVLNIESSKGELLPINTINYLGNGNFSYQFTATSDMPDGEYKVSAFDINTKTLTSNIKFRVLNPIFSTLTIEAPNNIGSYGLNFVTKIIWSDKVFNAITNNSTGLVQKQYKIEYTNNNGNTWNTIEAIHRETAHSNQSNTFTKKFSFNSAGTYKVRISDLDNAANVNTSKAFHVVDPVNGGYLPTLEWDVSSPLPDITHPIGLAADGTSRILIKLTRDGSITKPVTSIHATIADANGNSSTQLLGKIKAAKNTTTYSDEANDANQIFCDTIFSTATSNTDFYFWLVAPDDYTQSATELTGERSIKVIFDFTYIGNPPSTSNISDIRIVRPPLLMVHGLNSDGETAWGNAKFNLGSGQVYFKEKIHGDIWKFGLLPNLLKYGSFLENASVLLGDTKNSFSAIIDSMHYKGFASCKVDYVCHSMGGSIARTASKIFPSYYLNRNYNKGYINKLITINTPHNGSYIADFFIDNFKSISDLTPPQTFFGKWPGKLDGFFDPQIKNKASQAVYDLQAYDGGKTFSKTTGIKNHLIGSDIDEFNTTFNIDDFKFDGATNGLLNILDNADLPKQYKYIPDYINHAYSCAEYYQNSDMVVPMSSQFPDKTESDIDIISIGNYSGSKANSIVYGEVHNGLFYSGIDASAVTHTGVTTNEIVGSRIMYLLNTQISSSNFLDTIAPNRNTRGSGTYLVNTLADSLISYFDTSHIKFINPVNTINYNVDSIFELQFLIKDTTGLRKVQVNFQQQLYQSFSKINNQLFNLKINPNSIGNNLVFVKGIYDSSGFVVTHIDTMTVKVSSLDTLMSIYVFPKSQNLNSNHFFNLTYNALFKNYVGILNNDIDSLSFNIADTNVVKYIDSLSTFVTKDTGTTHIVFNYKGFVDTAFIYVNQTENLLPLPVDLISFSGNALTSFNLLQWKAAGDESFSHFILQKSTDAQHWIQLTQVGALPGSVTYNYEYKDTSSMKEAVVYYRLIMADRNGTSKVSNIVIVRRGKVNTGIKVFPNPVVKDEIFIDMGIMNSPSKITIELFDLTGKNIKRINSAALNNPLRIDLKGLRPSTYMLKVGQGENIQTFKIIVPQ